MSGSETGVVTSREPYSVGFQKNPAPAPSPSPTHPVVQNIRLSYSDDGTNVYQPTTGSSPPYHPSAGRAEGSAGAAVLPHNLNMNTGELIKRKRGRPRKYGPDGSMALALIPPATTYTPSTGAFSPPPAAAGATVSPGVLTSPSSSSFKKARGRPPGSSKKQQMEALGSAGVGFTPHIITVKAGEDVSSKIMSFSQHGTRAVCILSASGAISNVTLRQAATCGGTATYEGRFDILSLSGSFLLTEVGGQRSRTGGLSISLAGPDGRVLGGCVAGLLTAASPVQVIVGSFIADGRREAKSVNQMEPLSVPHQMNFTTGGGSRSPPSHGTMSESSGGAGSPLNQSTGTACNNNNTNPAQGLSMSGMPWK